MIGWLWRVLVTPRISERLLRHLDEVLVEDVRHHWVVFIKPALLALLGCVMVGAGFAVVSVNAGWFCFGAGGLLLLWAAFRALTEHKDRLVLTNMRVFRVRGVIAESAATMPLSRVLDITVQKTLTGRLLGYGHFVFESAAQEQGLREIRFVPRPDRLDLMIQEQVQQAGLRGKTRAPVSRDDAA
ncbi:MAG: rane-flanked domain protein [Nocardioidaceae bacterium]|nr:rane-flanked domain protein [Nocardioidaceae bacterium]